MSFMIELHFSEQHRTEALDYFWSHGACHYEGKVSIKGLWVASGDRIAYALVNADNRDEVDRACRPLREFGEVYARPVASSDEL